MTSGLFEEWFSSSIIQNTSEIGLRKRYQLSDYVVTCKNLDNPISAFTAVISHKSSRTSIFIYPEHLRCNIFDVEFPNEATSTLIHFSQRSRTTGIKSLYPITITIMSGFIVNAVLTISISKLHL